jgi:hypothetical protein
VRRGGADAAEECAVVIQVHAFGVVEVERQRQRRLLAVGVRGDDLFLQVMQLSSCILRAALRRRLLRLALLARIVRISCHLATADSVDNLEVVDRLSTMSESLRRDSYWSRLVLGVRVVEAGGGRSARHMTKNVQLVAARIT